MRRRTLLTMLLYPVVTSAQVLSSQQKSSNISEHFFDISENQKIGIRELTTTPQKFVENNSDIEAAINGPYFSPNNKTQGIAYLADGHQLADGNINYVRGYFSVNKNGNEVKVNETLLDGTGTLDEKLRNYWLVIGTHPLLVVNRAVHAQSREDRYKYDEQRRIKRDYRSAIGTKYGKAIYFAVSEDKITMEEWAERLRSVGYLGAINLDGGPISQLAVRENKIVKIKGQGTLPTRLVIFEYTK